MIGPVTAQLSDLVDLLNRRGPEQLRLMAGDGSYSEIIASVAVSRANEAITAERLAWILTGIGWRETKLGTSPDCDYPGPGCTGDFTARLATAKRRTGRHQILVELPARWRAPVDENHQVLPGPYAIPIDLRGYGRSEWQHDYDAHPEVVDELDNGTALWGRSRWACDQAAARFLEDLATLGKERLALAAFNCGVGGVRRALDAGLSIDWNTTGRNYSGWILDHIKAWAG